MNPLFFPEKIAFVLAEPWMWETPLPFERDVLSPTVAEKRLREFRAGRHCANNALQQLGIKHHTILRGERGEPLWPEGICGSISHAGERCVAIAAHQRDYLSIAVDIEKDRLIKDDTLERVSHQQERLQLEQAPEKFSQVNVRAILFSIKECVHKIYYPLNFHTLDFLDVETLIDWEQQTFLVKIISPKPGASYVVEKLSGRFGYEEGYVYSQICLRRDFTYA